MLGAALAIGPLAAGGRAVAPINPALWYRLAAPVTATRMDRLRALGAFALPPRPEVFTLSPGLAVGADVGALRPEPDSSVLERERAATAPAAAGEGAQLTRGLALLLGELPVPFNKLGGQS